MDPVQQMQDTVLPGITGSLALGAYNQAMGYYQQYQQAMGYVKQAQDTYTNLEKKYTQYRKMYKQTGKRLPNLRGKNQYKQSTPGQINKQYNPHSSRMYKKKWKRAAYKKSNKRYKKAKPKYVKKSRKGQIRQSRYQSKFFKRLNKRNKYTANIVNDVNPQKAGCVLYTYADSYKDILEDRDVYDLKYLYPGTRREYNRQLRIDGTSFLLSRSTASSAFPDYKVTQPVDKFVNQKLGPYKKARINSVTVRIGFQFFGDFDGYIYMIPGLKSSDPVVGNGVASTTNPIFNFNNPQYTAYPFFPNITTEAGRMQSSIKLKKVVQMQGTREPPIHYVSATYKLRELDLELKNKEAYNDQYLMNDITLNSLNSYQIDGHPIGKHFNLSFGFESQMAQVQQDNQYCRMSIRMCQKVQLQEPIRVTLGDNHKLV